MSDDTPTQRFDAAGDAPTQRMAAPSEEVVEERKSRKLMIILGAVGAALLLALIIVLVLLLTKSNAIPGALPAQSASASPAPSVTPTKSATPTATPTPTPTQTQAAPPPPPPPNTATTVTGFEMDKSHNCSQGEPVYLQVSWSSENGVAAYFGVNTNDAQTGGMGWTLPPNGNQDDFLDGYVPYEYQCGNSSTDYTITIVGSDGTKASKKITVKAEN
ncbi:MAG: hypothetical protein JWP19_2281 [Rhodoglobus sp.]|nr:hypothetical protein [Rhodoglobus sp.]